MKKDIPWRSYLLKTHFISLGIVFLNALSGYLLSIRIITELEFLVKCTLIGSAIILFFVYKKAFRFSGLYFFSYFTPPFIVITSWLMDGLLGAILLSIFLFPIYPDTLVHQNNNIRVLETWHGVMGSQTIYKVTEQKLFIFDRTYAEFIEGYIDPESIELQRSNDDVTLSYSTYAYSTVNRTLKRGQRISED